MSPTRAEDQSLAGRTFGVFLLRGVGAALAIGSTLLVARLFGAGATGTYYLAVAAATVGMTIGRVGLDLPMMRIVAVDIGRDDWPAAKGVVGRASTVVAVAAGSAGTLLFLLASPLGNLFDDPDLPSMLRLTSMAVLPGSLTMLYAAILRGAGRPSIAEVAQRAVFFAVFILGVLAMATRMQEASMGLAYAGAYVVTLLLVLGVWRLVTPEARPDRAGSTRALVVSGLPLLLAASVTLAIRWTDIFMLSAFDTPSAVGVYSVASRVAGLISFVLISASAVIAPKFAVLYANGDMLKLQRLVRRSTLGTASAALVLALLLCAARTEVLGLFGEEFIAGASALLILVVGQLIHSAFGLVGSLLAMTGREKRLMFSTLAAAVANVVLNWILIPRFGIEGAALASVISIAILNIVNALFARFDLGIGVFGRIR